MSLGRLLNTLCEHHGLWPIPGVRGLPPLDERGQCWALHSGFLADGLLRDVPVRGFPAALREPETEEQGWKVGIAEPDPRKPGAGSHILVV